MAEIKLRELKSTDLFSMFGILSKIGLKDLRSSLSQESIQSIISDVDGDKDDEAKKNEVGFALFLEIAEIILANLPKCEKEIFAFLAGLSGLTAEEVADLDLVTFTDMVITVLTRDDFRDFFERASGLFSKTTN